MYVPILTHQLEPGLLQEATSAFCSSANARALGQCGVVAETRALTARARSCRLSSDRPAVRTVEEVEQVVLVCETR